MDSKRLLTMKAISEFLAREITTDNGYQHDLTAKVFRGRLHYGANDPLPCLSILDNPDPDRFPKLTGWHDQNSAGVSLEDWTILVQGWAEDDKVNPTDTAFNLMADVRKALAKVLQEEDPRLGRPENPDYKFGDLIEGMTMEPGVVRPPQEGVSSRAFFWFRIHLKFVENQDDPYDAS